MGAAPSIPPPAPEPVADLVEGRTLRGDNVPRTLVLKSVIRAEARRVGAAALDRACVAAKISDDVLAKAMGLKSDRQGAEARSGAMPVTMGEAILLTPNGAGERAAIALLIEKRSRDRAAGRPSQPLSPEEREYFRARLLEDALDDKPRVRRAARPRA